MNKCIKCGSYAFNLHKDNIDQGSLCDVHYWQGRAHRAEAQPDQKLSTQELDAEFNRGYKEGVRDVYARQPQRTWVGLTDDEFEAVWLKHHDEHGYLRNENQEGWAYEKELLAIYKEKNT